MTCLSDLLCISVFLPDRHLAIAGSHGHVATFDWQAGRLHSEIQLGETVRDIKFLHSEAFYAVAQKKYVFIYDQFGTEVQYVQVPSPCPCFRVKRERNGQADHYFPRGPV